MKEKRANVNICWKCGEKLPDHFQMNSAEMRAVPRRPLPGDISCCGGCGAFSIFNGLLQLEKPDTRAMRAIYNTPELMDMQARMLQR